MDTNEPGREPTDAELLRFRAEMDRLRMECAANHSEFDEYNLACIADSNAHKAVMCRGREYLSGQRPMPPVNSDRNILKNIASWANQGVTITAMPGGAFVDDAGNLSGICVTGFPDTPAPDEQDATLVKLIDLLTRTANAVKGQPGEMKQHGWADLPELCTALTARVAGLEVVVDAAVKWLDRNGPDADIDLAGVVGDYVSEQTMRRINAAPRKGADQ